jgi:hypothetical protein
VHAMIRRYRMGAGSVEDLMRTVDTTIADRAQSELGITGYHAIALDDGTIMTVTLFRTEEHLRAAEPMAERIRLSLAEFEVEAVGAHRGHVMVGRGSAELTEPIHVRDGT